MGFDVAVGMSGGQLNDASAAVYQALYPKVFTGKYQAEYSGMNFTIDVDVQAAPRFELSVPQPVADVARALSERFAAEPAAPAEPAEGDRDEIIAAVAQAFPSFAMTLPQVALTISNGLTSKLTLDLTAQCYVENGPTTISFVPYSVTAPDQPNPVTDYLVKHVVLPAVQAMLTKLFAGVTIPPIQVQGIPLSSPSVGIARDHVIAAVNLAAYGTPPPPDPAFPWPDSRFFALLGPNVIQQLAVIAAASSTNRFSDGGSGGDWWAGYRWNYGLSLTNPRASIQGGGVRFDFTLRGTVSAGVHVTVLSIDLGFDAFAEPDPSANASFSVSGSQLILTAQSVAPFTIFVIPNSVPTWVLGWLITAIINGVTVTLTPLISTFLKNIRLASYDVPTYTVDVEGTRLKLTPVNLAVGSVAGTIALTGSATIGPGEAADNG